MQNFWDFSVWGGIHLVAVLLLSLLTANMIKRSVPFLRNSLIPTSVLGGILLLLLSIAYKAITGNVLFDTAFFGVATSAVEQHIRVIYAHFARCNIVPHFIHQA